MQGAQQRFERMDQRMAGAALFRLGRFFREEGGLRQFQVPIAVFVPGEFVERTGDHIQTIVEETFFDALQRCRQPRAYPAIGKTELRARGARVLALDVHQRVAGGVPQLITEVSIAFDSGHVELEIAALRGQRREAQPQRVRAVRGNALRELLARGLLDGGFHLRLHQARGALRQQVIERDAVDDVERIDHVALRLGHFLSVVVANQSVHVNLTERYLTGELQAHHDHAGHPEENDVEARDQYRRRVIPAQRRRVVRPPLGGERP